MKDDRIIHCYVTNMIPLIRWCLDDILEMKNYKLHVLFCDSISLSGSYGRFSYPDIIWINNDMTRSDQERTILHELRHYFQYQTKMFDFESPEFSTQYKTLSSTLEYNLLPWELDANKFAVEMWGKFQRRNNENSV
jgi:hypothetical protein